MKKFFVLLSLLFVASPVLAEVERPFDFAYTVASSGSTTEVTEFDINGSTPFLYLNLPSIPHNDANSSVLSNWNFGGFKFALSDAGTSNSQSEFWLAPSALLWDSNKALGNWSIDASYIWDGPGVGSNDNFGSKTVNFNVVDSVTVTPEPASMALFGLGAGLLGLKRIRRKKA